jgi:hypothetical protein
MFDLDELRLVAANTEVTNPTPATATISRGVSKWTRMGILLRASCVWSRAYHGTG